MEKYTGLEIAVIGVSGRFPKADNISTYWENLRNGVDCVSTFSKEDALMEGESREVVNNPAYIKSNAYLENKDRFDSAFFNYRPEEAELMDPQMRIYHECCWEALEDSGYSPKGRKESIGVFASGSPKLQWQLYSLFKNQAGLASDFSTKPLSDVSFLSSRISYLFDLRGPVFFLQTACSSSLVAIHEACNSLLLGECKMALAGGVNVQNFSKKGYIYQEGMIHSRDGKCRPFDENSSGTINGEGAGVVVLKRLKDALADRDNIHAIIKGSAINNDGKNKVGYSAPSSVGQAIVIKNAQKRARIKPESISFVEGHGTATNLGDPIEVEALNEVFKNCEPNSCVLGSVKSNFGHLDSAAGVAGFIKVVLALKNKLLPPTLHFQQANPRIDFKGGPFYVSNSPINLQEFPAPLRAGVSSFGIGGTNAHVIVEEAPKQQESSQSRDFQLLLVSAKSTNSLQGNTDRIIKYLEEEHQVPMADIAYTLHVGRERFDHRSMLVCKHNENAAQMLQKGKGVFKYSRKIREDLQQVVFMFPGQGTQYENMCKDVYLNEKVFRDKVDECLEIAKSYTEADLRSILYPTENKASALSSNINDTQYTQPLLFIIEYSLAHLMINWGIKPDYMIGHSIGEYVAACLSGVFNLEDALRLVIKRGELMSQAEKGSMLSISIKEEELIPILNQVDNIDIAVINSQSSLVVSGTDADIKNFKQLLLEAGHESKILHTSHAFHSYMMDSILHDFEQEIATGRIHEPQIPYISNVTGEETDFDQLNTASYWSSQLRNSVQFLAGVQTLLKKGNTTFIEVGPGKTLCNYIAEIGEGEEGHNFVNLVRHPKQQLNDQKYLTEKLGQLWMKGIDIDWTSYYQHEKRNRVSLPTYSFEASTYKADFDIHMLLNANAIGAGLVEDEMNKDIIHVANWQRTESPNQAIELQNETHKILVFTDKHGFSQDLIKELQVSNQLPIEIKTGNTFTKVSDNCYELNPLDPDHLSRLWERLGQTGTMIDNIIYCGALGSHSFFSGYESLDNPLAENYLGLSYLAQSIANAKQAQKLNVTVINNHLASVTEEDELNPIKASIYAPAKIMPLELLNVQCKVIDIPFPFESRLSQEIYTKKLLNEIFYDSPEDFIAYRYQERWKKSFAPLHIHEKTGSGVKIQSGATYIVTGGFGGMGFSIIKDLVNNHDAHIILVHRSSFPSKNDWDKYLAEHGEEDRTSEKIQEIRKLEEGGSQIDLYQVDISIEHQVGNFASQIKQANLNIDGLIWAAGEVDYGGVMQNRDHEGFVKHLTSKVHGVLLFEKYFEFEKLNFIALFSSMGNIFYQAKFGQVAYNAANEFLEAYAHYARKKFGSHAFTINWSDWLNVGMSVKTVMKEKNSSDINLINASILDGIYPEEGVEVFHTCLQSKSPVMHIYRGNLEDAIQQSKKEFVETKASLTDAVSLADVEEEVGSLEERILSLYAQFFGKDSINLQDDFFELGGDSLKAMILVARINKETGADLTIKDIYTFPTIAQLLEELSKHSIDNSNSIPQAPKKDTYGLSPMQKGMYFLQRSDLKNTAYNEVRMFWVKGIIDIKKLTKVFNQLIQRHEGLRTAFIFQDETPRQVVLEECSITIESLTFQKNRLTESINAFIRPFDLSQAPLCRVGILEKKTDEHLLIVDMHHIINDVSSFRIFMQDFERLYAGENLAELSIQYKDYVEWTESEEQQELKEKQRAFWLEKFANTTPLDLPTDFSRPAEKSYEGQDLNFEIDELKTKQLRAIAKEKGVSLYMLMVSVFSVLLSKLSTQEDISIGTVTAGRQHTDLESIIGMFATTVPLRYYPKGTLYFDRFLQQVKEQTLSYFENQAFPYEELVSDLQLSRNTSRNPLFDTFFTYYNFEDTIVEMEGLQVKPFENKANNAAKFDLTLNVAESEEKLFLAFNYSTKLFKPQTIDRYIKYFQKIIETITNKLETKISEIELLTDKERQETLFTFNNTLTPYSDNKTLVDLFEEQARKSPESIALSNENEEVNYKTLDQLSSQIAGYLQSVEGLKEGDLVAVMLERELYLIPTILGILKTGAAYVPIDPQYPAERLNTILDDSEAKILLSRASYLSGEISSSVKQIDLDKDLQSLLAHSMISKSLASPQSLAYVLYTSGSTGKPKGVMVAHSSLVNYIEASIKNYVKGEKLNFPLFTSISFDLTVTSIFTPLLSGNQLILYRESGNGLELEKVIQDNQCHILKLTPSHLKVLTYSSNIPGEGACNIKRLIVGGEDLKTDLAQEIHKILGEKVEIFNEYGPTEATVGCMIYLYDPADATSSVPIGIPIDNTQIYLLDTYLQPVPQGVLGEIYIGGKGLAKGYQGKAALSASKFIENPFVAGEKMYKSGDHAIRLDNGNILYKGRIDDQVKIRGFRVELGEIESRLKEHTEIREVLVLGKEKQGDKYLVAYYVSEEELPVSELNAHVSENLPEYMIPGFYKHLEKFPLTSNGKVDTKRLPDIEVQGLPGLITPTNELEENLLEIWSEVLGFKKEHISTTANFFEIGGHSLKALAAIGKIQKVLNLGIRTTDFFKNSSIKKLSDYILSLDNQAHSKLSKKTLKHADLRESYPASPSQERMYYQHLLHKESTTFNISIPLEIKGNLDIPRLTTSFQKLFLRHENLRTSFFLSDQGITQKINEDYHFELEMLDPEIYPTIEEAFQAFSRSFDLSQESLFRAGLFSSKDKGNILFVEVHHIITDKISFDILLQDFMQIYNGKNLPKLNFRYVDYACWIKEDNAELERQKEFWRQKLSGDLSRVDLPIIRERDTIDIQKADFLDLRLEEELYQGLLELSHEAEVSNFMFFLSVYYVFLAKISDTSDVIVGTEVRGRTHPELEGIVGNFINLLPLRITINPEEKYVEFLRNVKNTVLDALDNQDFQFDKMLSLVNENLEPNRYPLFDAHFSISNQIQNDSGTNGDLSELEFSRLQVNNKPRGEYEFSINLSEENGSCSLRFIYRSELYDAQTIESLVDYFHNIIKGVVRDPKLKIQDIEIESMVEQAF